ncbi:MAG TPA: hypothetical protein VJC10_02900 [Patescibacteria group bacterium]|nr:hypothetical protein [Patescibacteria group bacterium]
MPDGSSQPEQGGGHAGNRFTDQFKKLFRRDRLPLPQSPRLEQPQVDLEPDPEALSRALDNIQRLIPQHPQGENMTPRVTEDGRMDALQVGELMNAQEKLSLSEANVGDTIWWRDKDGRTGWYLVTEPYIERDDKADQQSRPGKGLIKIDDDSKPIQRKGAVIWGASFGGMLMTGSIAKNIPVVYKLPFDVDGPGRDGEYYTKPIVDMGIIRASEAGVNHAAIAEANMPEDMKDYLKITVSDQLAIDFFEDAIQREVNPDQLMGEILSLPVPVTRRNFAGYEIRDSMFRDDAIIPWKPTVHIGPGGRALISLLPQWGNQFGAVALKYAMLYAQKFSVSPQYPDKRNNYILPYLHMDDQGANNNVNQITLIAVDQPEFEDIQRVLNTIAPEER